MNCVATLDLGNPCDGVTINLDETPLADLKVGLQSYLIDLANELQQPSR